MQKSFVIFIQRSSVKYLLLAERQQFEQQSSFHRRGASLKLPLTVFHLRAVETKRHTADRRKLWSQHLDSVKCLRRLTGPARMFAIAKYSRMVRSRQWLSANNRVDVSIPGRNRSLIPLLSFDELSSTSSIHTFTLDFHLWWVVLVDFSFF